MLHPFAGHRGSNNPPLSSGAASAHLPSDLNNAAAAAAAAVRLNLMSDGRDHQQAMSSNMAGELHQTLTMHSQSQKNMLGVGNHPDSALEQNNGGNNNGERNMIAYGTYNPANSNLAVVVAPPHDEVTP